MRYLSTNIFCLRTLKDYSQDQLAKLLNVGRTTVVGWEKGSSKPNLEVVIKISDIFSVSIDDLIKADMSNELTLKELEKIRKTQLGKKLEKIGKKKSKNLFVPVRAQAGYTEGWNGDNFNGDLQYIDIPDIPKDMEARTFEIEGFSMYPIVREGDYLVCTKVEHNDNINADSIYIVLTKFNGLLVKFLRLSENEIELISYNDFEFAPIKVPKEEVLELWKARYKITRHFSSGTNGQMLRKLNEIGQFIQKTERL